MNEGSQPLDSDPRLAALLLHHEIHYFNAAYAAALDEQRLTDWVEMFTDDAFYVVISRENADKGLPVGLIYCDSKAMIYDRAFALEKTAMFAPRYLRHIIGNLQVLEQSGEASIRARANYALIEGAVRSARRQASPGGRLSRRLSARERRTQARRTAMCLRQPSGRQRAVPARVKRN